MRTGPKLYPSLDDQILMCIEATKNLDEFAKLEDFQLRLVENDLILFSLKTGQSFALYDSDNEPFDQHMQPLPLSAARPLGTAVIVASWSVATVKRLAHHILGWFVARQSLSPRAH
jgi:hypothetical protein